MHACATLSACLLLGALSSALSAADHEVAAFDRDIRPVLKEYCLDCHSTKKQKGDLDLEVLASIDGIRRHPRVWQQVLEQLADQEMPPKDKPQPSAAQKAALVGSVRGTLDALALKLAGDPGPVVLRRLSNAEYTSTIRDLTRVVSLDPAREFPVDGAAGEGFTNTGQALVMSPSLVRKYLDAAKDIAAHAVLLPDGLRFSPSTTRRDWTDELLAEVRAFYARYSESGGTDTVTLQGIVMDKSQGGRLPIEKYLAAALELRAPGADAASVARARGLSLRYLTMLVALLAAEEPSPLLAGVRARWRTAKPEDIPGIVQDIALWQKALWRFNGVGHLGRTGGPSTWLEAVTPLAATQEVRHKFPADAKGDQVVWLQAGDAGDGARGDLVVWRQPRLEFPGRPPLLLRDARTHVDALLAGRARLLAETATILAAASEAGRGGDLAALAAKHGVAHEALAAWCVYLGIGGAADMKLDLMTSQLAQSAGFDFVQGWGSHDTPLLLGNASDRRVRIPGVMKPHGVAAHPSQTLAVAVGWRSPVAASLRIAATVTDAHPDCGNGATWALELRRGATRQRLAQGTTQGGQCIAVGPVESVAVQPGDLVSLLIGPRDGEHTCDLTDLEFTLASGGDAAHEWSLTREVAGSVLAGNPHADGAGRAGVWHFYTEPLATGASVQLIPPGSLLARWQAAAPGAQRQRLAEELQRLLTAPRPAGDGPDAILHRQLTALSGPLAGAAKALPATAAAGGAPSPWGVDPARFGRRPDGTAIDAGDLCVQAPELIEIRLPAELVAGGELVATGALDALGGGEGSVRLRLRTARPEPDEDMGPASGTIVVTDQGPARARLVAAFDEHRRVFPASLCYTRIVPVDEVVTLTLFHREDDQLVRLMLEPPEAAALDRLWDQLRYVSQDALAQVDVFEQLWQYATQESSPEFLEPKRKPIMDAAAAFRQRLLDTAPAHLEAALRIAGQAYRRPLAKGEAEGLRALYRALRAQELAHDDAIRLVLARVLVGPAFLYRAEKPAPGEVQGPVSDWELASRLSYFLWSSQPDDELRAQAAAGMLRDPAVLDAQARRLLRDPRMRRMATEFGCAWLHIAGFDQLDEKSERHFPTFVPLRGDMYEEAIRFFADFFQSDRPVLSLLDADHAFLTEALARHYGIPGVDGPEWRRVEGMRQHGRGGILGMAATLAKQSGASRTSPILRGNWVAEALLGDKLPRPPKDVPLLPEDEATEQLTMRQLTERHTKDERCSGCHKRIDPFGYALEGFDAIGRRRDKDLGDRPIDTATTVMDGTRLEGLPGLRAYLLEQRRDAFLRQFCRKLLGYALGRSVQLSDQPLLAELQARLAQPDARIGTAISMIVRSRQFREIRGRDAVFEE